MQTCAKAQNATATLVSQYYDSAVLASCLRWEAVRLLQMSDDAALGLAFEERLQWCKHCGAHVLTVGASRNLVLHEKRGPEANTLLNTAHKVAPAQSRQLRRNAATLAVLCEVCFLFAVRRVVYTWHNSRLSCYLHAYSW